MAITATASASASASATTNNTTTTTITSSNNNSKHPAAIKAATTTILLTTTTSNKNSTSPSLVNKPRLYPFTAQVHMSQAEADSEAHQAASWHMAKEKLVTIKEWEKKMEHREAQLHIHM